MMLKITRVITDLSFLEFLVFIIYWVTDLTSRYSIEILLYDENGQIFIFAVPDKYSDDVLHGLISYLQFMTGVHGIPLIKHYVSHQMRR